MSRSGYAYDLDNWDLIRWRGRVASSIPGQRGQKLLRDIVAALEAMPAKRLIAHDLENESGEVCALGAAAKLRGVDLKDIDPEEPEQVAATLDIAYPLACEIAYLNDEGEHNETPEHRYERLKRWCEAHLNQPGVGGRTAAKVLP